MKKIKIKTSNINQYDFTLTLAVPTQGASTEALAERLYSEGCDDALIGIGQHGRIGIEFSREAVSASDAVTSALADVHRIIPGVRLIEASPDLVGLTDIANVLGFSRQNMRKMLVKSGAAFPLPVHDGKPAIWHLSSVLEWFSKEKGREFDQRLLEISLINRHCNLLKESAEVDAVLLDRLKAVVA